MTHNPAPMTHNVSLDPDHRYGCHNKQDSTITKGHVQAGWTSDGRRNMVERKTEWLEIGCGHSFKDQDPACSGCRWRR